ncbi:MAG: HNH endonuclease signature motif containing protein [Sarcina sp.]
MLLKKCICGLMIPLGTQLCSDCLKKRKQKYSKGYKPPRRNYKEQKFYCSKEWFIARDKVRDRDNKLCMICYSQGLIKSVGAVHHIIELKEDWNKRTDINNLICVCKKHHDTVHNLYLDPREKELLQEDLRSMIGLLKKE